jgi:hypothetical protein
MPQDRVNQSNNAIPPRLTAEATRKCPLIPKAGTKKPPRSDFFNSLSQEETSTTVPDEPWNDRVQHNTDFAKDA